MDTPDRSSSSVVRVVQDVRGVYGDELGVAPPDVVLALRDAVSRSSVDAFWSIWSQNAEAGLFRAYCGAGGPTEAGSSAFLGRGLLRIRSRRLERQSCWTQWCLADCTGSATVMRWMFSSAQHFVDSSLAPVLLFRGHLKSVADVLKGIRSRGFTQAMVGGFAEISGCRLSSWPMWSDLLPAPLG